ncbi:discoidin domain-containing protein [Bacteroides pyogenes]|uniref:discoidin domain-containing protein n=1 Tax=Bacteroides pyogenes TaxID=310300 RepID=UPI002FDA33A2
MRAVYYDEKGGKHNLLNGEVLIPISVMDIYMAASATAPTGTVIPTDTWTVTMEPAALYSKKPTVLTDGSSDTNLYLAGNTTVIVDMGKKEAITGLQIASGSYTASYPASISLYSSDDKTNWKELSGVWAWGNAQWANYLTLKSLSTRYIKIEVTAAKYKLLSEIKIYK